MIIRLKTTKRITASHLELVDSRMIRHAGGCIVFLFQHVRSYLCCSEGGCVKETAWSLQGEGGGCKRGRRQGHS